MMDIVPPRNASEPQPAPVQPAPAPNPMPAPPPPVYSTPPHSNDKSPIKSILSTIGLFASAFLIAILLNTFVIQSYQVDGESMQPTLQNDDRLIVDKIPRTFAKVSGKQYVPKRGQIIIFNEDGLPGFIGTKQLIKRVIGLPGEHIVVDGSKVTVYNTAHPEGFNPDTTGAYAPALGISCGNADVTIPANEVFVMGDNRGNSEDSRCFGPINTDQVVAKLVLRILPLNKAKSF